VDGHLTLKPTAAGKNCCGDYGEGGMCDWQDIVAVIEERLFLSSTLKLEGS
jgi:hypothetical protein